MNTDPPPDYQATANPAVVSDTTPIHPLPTAMIRPLSLFGRYPVQMRCANCGRTVITTVMKENGPAAYIAVGVILVLFFPFAWIPLCVQSCKDVYHYCPVCKAMLGSLKKI